MIKPLLLVLAIGTVIGLALPGGKDAPPPVVANGFPQETVLEKRRNGHFYVDANVNGELVNFVVDTGASFVALTIEDARRIGVPVDRDAFTIVGEGASGPIRGVNVKLASVSIDGKTATDVNGAVLEGLSVSLLGQSYLSRIGSVQMAGDYMTLR